MNKYQEALERIKQHMVTYHKYPVSKEQDISISELQEAIDKAIIYDDKEKGINVKYTTTGISYCGNCSNSSLHNSLGNKMIYCSKCGYKINWGRK